MLTCFQAPGGRRFGHGVASDQHTAIGRRDDAVGPGSVVTIRIAKEEQKERRENRERNGQRPGDGPGEDRQGGRAADERPPGRIDTNTRHRHLS